jgi:mycoredoxin-dependent peroxiredoxin
VLKTMLAALALIAVVVASVAWTSWKLFADRPVRPVAGSFHRSKVDGSGHTRGIVQVDLMRQIMEGKTRSTSPTIRRIPTQEHPLLGRRAPALVLEDSQGKTWDLGEEVSNGPVVVVFTLGSTCVACVTHMVELDAATSRFRERKARVLAVSGDSPEFSTGRARKFGGFRIPLLSDPDHSASMAFGVWKPVPGEALHGTFIVDREGLVRWAHVGDRPFNDVEALLAELDRGLKTGGVLTAKTPRAPR